MKITVLQQGFEAENRIVDAKARATPVNIQLRVAGLSSSVVVTGGRDAVEIDKSVVAVNAVDRSDIEVRNLRLIDQSLDYEEGLNVYREKGAADTSTAVRDARVFGKLAARSGAAGRAADQRRIRG